MKGPPVLILGSLTVDVLNAQTALTEAHGSFVDALRDYSVARANLVRAIGANLLWASG
jgi:outer membrane protein TolC